VDGGVGRGRQGGQEGKTGGASRAFLPEDAHLALCEDAHSLFVRMLTRSL